MVFAEFARALRRAFHCPALLRIPAFALRLADDVLLSGRCVPPGKALETSYQFLYPTLAEALGEIVG